MFLSTRLLTKLSFACGTKSVVLCSLLNCKWATNAHTHKHIKSYGNENVPTNTHKYVRVCVFVRENALMHAALCARLSCDELQQNIVAAFCGFICGRAGCAASGALGKAAHPLTQYFKLKLQFRAKHTNVRVLATRGSFRRFIIMVYDHQRHNGTRT